MMEMNNAEGMNITDMSVKNKGIIKNIPNYIEDQEIAALKCVHCSGDHRSVECETKYEKHCTNCHNNPSQPHKTFAQAIYSQASQPHDTNNGIKKQFLVKNQTKEVDLDKVKNYTSHEDTNFENLNNTIKNRNEMVGQLKDTIAKLTENLEHLEFSAKEQRICSTQSNMSNSLKNDTTNYARIAISKERKDKETSILNSTKDMNILLEYNQKETTSKTAKTY
ncbi:hypothetical protein GJ496_010476 [Pomphorhynchus laevis]|nr:hypothetical protein GJ496_010476 [Pomphorhynchus laevis]